MKLRARAQYVLQCGADMCSLIYYYLLVIWIINKCDCRRLQTRHPNTTIEYYSLPKPGINIDIMIHMDKMLTKKLAQEYKTRTRKKIKTISNNILREVEKMYKHPSLSQKIRFRLIDTRFFKNNSDVVNIDENVSVYLKSYCNWQAEKKMRSRRGYYSVLLTGLDVYYVNNRGDKVRSSTGRGYMGGICNVHKSCSILEWHPRNTGYLLAHELAHSMGLSHDGPPHNSCKPHGHIMAAKYDRNNHPRTWSACCREDLSDFVESRKGRCLQSENRIQVYGY